LLLSNIIKIIFEFTKEPKLFSLFQKLVKFSIAPIITKPQNKKLKCTRYFTKTKKNVLKPNFKFQPVQIFIKKRSHETFFIKPPLKESGKVEQRRICRMAYTQISIIVGRGVGSYSLGQFAQCILIWYIYKRNEFAANKQRIHSEAMKLAF